MNAPKRGDVIRVNFDPRRGHEQAGHRPALVLSNTRYNVSTGMLIACPVTSQVKGYPLEVSLPESLKTSGVVLAHQVKALGWRAREVRVVETAPVGFIEDVLSMLITLLEEDT